MTKRTIVATRVYHRPNDRDVLLCVIRLLSYKLRAARLREAMLCEELRIVRKVTR